MNKNQDKGFTLIELLIVIVVLGILATVTVFAVGGITEDAQQNSCAVELRTIETGVQAFYASQAPNAYPDGIQGDPGVDGLFGTADDVSSGLEAYLDDPSGAEARFDVDAAGEVTATVGQNCEGTV